MHSIKYSRTFRYIKFECHFRKQEVTADAGINERIFSLILFSDAVSWIISETESEIILTGLLFSLTFPGI